jgi:putative FmdB family regulatory protein
MYQCESCGHMFEVRHSFKERLEDCPSCDKTKNLVRVLSTPANIQKRRLQKNTAGTVVKTTIEEIKQDLKSEKDSLKKRAKK